MAGSREIGGGPYRSGWIAATGGPGGAGTRHRWSGGEGDDADGAFWKTHRRD
jgi:hypothetical protein